MRLFGLEIRRVGKRQARESGEKAAVARTRPTWANPFRNKLANYVPLRADFELYRTLREAIPLLDVAINRLSRLIGYVLVEGSEPLATDIMNFLRHVRVNACQWGIDNFLTNHTGCMLQYGRAAGEIVLDRRRRDIYALLNIDPDSIRLVPVDPPLKIAVAQQQPGRAEPVVIPEELVIYSVNNPEGDDPHGVSLFRSLPFVARVMLTMEQAIHDTWERMGTPSYQVIWRPPETFVDADGSKTRAIMAEIEQSFTNAMRQRAERTGAVADFFAAGDIEIKVIGADGQELSFLEPYRALAEQLVARTGLPPFMLGLHWSTTERMSQQQAEMIIAEIKDMRRELEPGLERLIDLWLRVNGRRGKWRLTWSEVTLQDMREMAEAEYRRALAEKVRIENMRALRELGIEGEGLLLASSGAGERTSAQTEEQGQ